MKNHKTINSKLLIAAKEQAKKFMLLSATMADNPMHFRAIGFALGLFPRIKDFWSWAQQYGVCADEVYVQYGQGETRQVWGFSGDATDLARLHKEIFPAKGGRIKKGDLGSLFPDNQVIVQEYDLGTQGINRMAEIQEEMQAALLKLRKKQQGDSDSELTVILRARQQAELLKVPIFVEEAENLIAEGNSVAIFVNFNETLREIAKKLDTVCVVHGGQTGVKGANERGQAIADFQAGRSRVIVLNLAAGGESISLHDLTGDYPRVSLISPSWSAQALIQVLGRIHRAGAKSKALQKLIYIAKSVESRVANAVRQKIGRIETLNDGDLNVYGN
jgi:hypothetical protein